MVHSSEGDEVYRVLPVTNSDGLDVSYRFRFGDWGKTLQANVGRNDTKISAGGSVQARRSWGVSQTTEHGALTARITFQKTSLTIAAVSFLFEGFRQFGPAGIVIADRYDSNTKPFSSLAIGASYDPGHWFVIAEGGHANTHSFIGKKLGGYVSCGYRRGKLAAHLTYAQARADNLSDPGLDVSSLPAFLAGPASDLNAGLNSILSAKTVQDTISIGGRWDLIRNAAFKVEYDHTRIGAGSAGTLSNRQPRFQPGGTIHVFSATIDLVF